MNSEAKSFIVRIWIESSEDDDHPTWRGVIEHVGTNDRQHFHELDTVTAFIGERTGLGIPKTPVDLWQTIKDWVLNELRKWRPDTQ
ncbi:MAG TPA: hypothetical protein VMN57_11900 [Anaerolineales bacterium]|nr:hypothetical protein [Anaerolineales bacterium]